MHKHNGSQGCFNNNNNNTGTYSWFKDDLKLKYLVLTIHQFNKLNSQRRKAICFRRPSDVNKTNYIWYILYIYIYNLTLLCLACFWKNCQASDLIEEKMEHKSKYDVYQHVSLCFISTTSINSYKWTHFSSQTAPSCKVLACNMSLQRFPPSATAPAPLGRILYHDRWVNLIQVTMFR